MTGVHSMKSQLLSYDCSRNWKFSKMGKDGTRCFDTLCFSLVILWFLLVLWLPWKRGGSSWGDKWLCAVTTLTLLHPFLLLSLKKKSMWMVWKIISNTGKNHMEWHQNHRIIFVGVFAVLLVQASSPPKGCLCPFPVKFWLSWRIS